MELVNTNDENFFDPKPRLKSSPIPIKFISFDEKDGKCFNCGKIYIESLYYDQKCYENCLSRYITSNDNKYLDLDIYYTMDLECNENEISKTKVMQIIQECCRSCLRILHFKQIYEEYLSKVKFDIHHDINMYNKVIESEKQCKLCKKSLGERTARQLSLCSDCYLISFERIESTLVKRQILILYLPWWHNTHNCNMCSSELTFTSDCQKYCTNCLIFYTGCRYCLTTNIIFGLTGQTHCKKCKRISLIIDNTVNRVLDDFLFNDNIYEDLSLDFAKTIGECFEPLTLLNYIFKEKGKVKPVRWIPYSQFKDVKEMTKGGYGIIYKATWLSYNKTVILKRFENSKNNNKYFLNELKSNQYCFNRTFYDSIIKIYGFTKDPELDDHVLVMEYASEGDLLKYLQKNFTNLTWNDNNTAIYTSNHKLHILQDILKGLEYIHVNKFIHRDFHSGNILLDVFQWNGIITICK